MQSDLLSSDWMIFYLLLVNNLVLRHIDQRYCYQMFHEKKVYIHSTLHQRKNHEQNFGHILRNLRFMRRSNNNMIFEAAIRSTKG